jgi:hypothetical protein
LRSRLNQVRRFDAHDYPKTTPQFDFREWLVPPVLVPVFFGLLIAAAVVLQR